MRAAGDARIGVDPDATDDAVVLAVKRLSDELCTSVDAVLGHVDVDARLLDALPAGHTLASLLARADVNTLAADAQLAFAAATERMSAWVQSLQNRALVAYAGEVPRVTQYDVDGRGEELVDVRRSHLASRLLWSESMAHARLTNARTLATSLPRTNAALAAGAISGLRANAIAESARTLVSRADAVLDASPVGTKHDELQAVRDLMLSEFEARTLRFAIDHDLSRTRGKARMVVARLDPDGLAWRRALAARNLTGVHIRHEADAMSTVHATMPSELAIECLRAIDACAEDPSRSAPELPIGIRRAHAMHGLLTGSLHACTHPAAGASGQDDAASESTRSRITRINVTVDLDTLLGLRHRPAALDDVGAIPADVVREILARSHDAAIRWLVTDAAGTVVDASPRRYRIGSALRELIIARDRTCSASNCSRPASRCEIDHVVPYELGGPSTPENLQPLCKRHHQLKTHGGAMPAYGFADRSNDGSNADPAAAVLAEHERDISGAVARVNSEFLAYERAMEYGEESAPRLGAIDSARELLGVLSAAERVRRAQSLLEHGPLVALVGHTLTSFQRRQRRARPRPQRDSGTSAPAMGSERGPAQDDTPPF